MTNSRLGKSVLVVDHKLDELSIVRDILSGLGFETIEAASSVNMGMSFLRMQEFDVVILSYDLGANEKNGLQLIQEAFAEELNLFKTLFLLVLEKESDGVLVGSLECAPDAYLLKPYDKSKIRARLDKLLRVKQAVLPMSQAMDQKEWKKATFLAARLISAYPGLKTYLERLQGICFLESQSYDAAEVLFSDVIESRQQSWAQVGLGMAHYYLADYDRATSVLNAVVQQNNISVEAFSWLAKAMQARGRIDDSLLLMRKAVLLQPTVPQLNSHLGNIAALSGDWPLAVSSFEASIKFARHTVFQNIEDYFALIRALLNGHQVKPMPDAELEIQVLKTTEMAIRDFNRDPVVIVRCHVVLAELRACLGNQELANSEQTLAVEGFIKLPIEDQVYWFDWVQCCLVGSKYEASFSKRKPSLLQSKSVPLWAAQMQSGLQFLQEKNLAKSYQSFQRAVELGGAAVELILNMSWVEVKLQQQGQDTKLCALPRLQKIHFGSLSQKQLSFYDKLLKSCV